MGRGVGNRKKRPRGIECAIIGHFEKMNFVEDGTLNRMELESHF